MKFQCKVNDDATGSQTVEFYIDDPDNLFDQDYDNIDFTLHNATVNVVAAPKPATDIKLNKNTLELTVGESQTLVATVEPADTTDTVTWDTGRSDVATVDSTGKVTAVAPGTAVIAARAGEKSAFCTVTVVAAPCTHTYKTYIGEKPSTCTKQGWDAYSRCDNCGQRFDMEGNPISEIPFRPLADHSLTPVAAKAATCTENGNKAYYKCDVCGKWFEDATANVEITDHSSVVLTALGHDYTEKIEDAAHKKANGLPQGRSTRSDQIGLEHHVAEHRQEKEQKAITEPLGGHPAGRGLAAGAFKVCPQLAEQLTPSAEVVAKVFVPTKDG